MELVPRMEAAAESARNVVKFLINLKATREAAGLSRHELANYLGVDVAYIEEIERVDADPRLSEIRRYLTACSASLNLGIHIHGVLR